jgi:hypothetical protein
LGRHEERNGQLPILCFSTFSEARFFYLIFFHHSERKNAMPKTERFTMRLTPQDKEVFAYLAKELKRSESDVLRTIAHEVAQAMKATTPAANQPTQAQA